MHPLEKLAALEQDVRAIDAAGELIMARRAPLADEATRKLAERVLENITNVSAEWLGHAVPVVEQLIRSAERSDFSDEDFIQALERMQAAMPTLFDRLNWHVLAEALEKAQGSAVVNGAIARQREFEESQKQ